MRAAVTRIGGFQVEEVADPVPGPGQVLVRTLACGICGSDLHAAADLRRFAGLVAEAGGPFGLDPDRGVVFGHEFCAEVVEYGPGTERALPVGTRVCSMPIVVVVGICMDADRIEPFHAVTKELEIRFSFGYRREEFAATLDRLGRRESPAGELVTRVVDLDGVADAFAALANATLGKVLVRP